MLLRNDKISYNIEIKKCLDEDKLVTMHGLFCDDIFEIDIVKFLYLARYYTYET